MTLHKNRLDLHANFGYDNAKMNNFRQLLEGYALNYKAPKYSVLLDDLQAGILKHHKKKHAEYLLIRFKQEVVSSTKNWITAFTNDRITSAKTQLDNHPEKTAIISTLALTYEGYQYLKIPSSLRPTSDAFRENMNSRVRFQLSGPKKEHVNTAGVHAIIMIASDTLLSDEAIEAHLNDSKSIISHYDRHSGKRNATTFGGTPLRDGISNPQFFPGASTSSQARPVNCSDLPSLDSVLVYDKGGKTLASCGSFGSFAKFEFNQGNIKGLVDAIQLAIGASNKDLPLAHILGRFADGTPLSLSDKKGNPTNDFDFSEFIKANDAPVGLNDLKGQRCPFHTHVRKANPREGETYDKKIVRRGMFYEKGNHQYQGLLFISFQCSLEKQFEHIVNDWMLSEYTDTGLPKNEAGRYHSALSSANRFRRTGVDFLFAKAGTIIEIPGEWNQSNSKKVSIKIEKQIIDCKGGLYFFTPAISFLKSLGMPPIEKAKSSAVQEKTLVSFVEGTEIKIAKIKDVDHITENSSTVEFVKGSEINISKVATSQDISYIKDEDGNHYIYHLQADPQTQDA